MVATGVIRSRLPKDNRVECFIKDPRLVELAKQHQTTKSAVAVDLWLERGLLDGAIIGIGNAPTALFRLLEVIRESGVKPAAIYGIPVGFVGAAESKQALVDANLGVDYITLLGRRGGSAMTVAAINAAASAHEGRND